MPGSVEQRLPSCARITYRDDMTTRAIRNLIGDFIAPKDRVLLDRQFEIGDPSQLPGLLDSPPDTDEVPEIEYAYDVTPPGGRSKGHAPSLKCVFPHSARHWRGFIVRWMNGNRARMGRDCGVDHLGFDFKAEVDRFESARSRQRDLKLFIALRSLLPDVVAELRALPRDPVVLDYDRLRREFGAAFPSLRTALGEIALSGEHAPHDAPRTRPRCGA
jgi:hypothetical protein